MGVITSGKLTLLRCLFKPAGGKLLQWYSCKWCSIACRMLSCIWFSPQERHMQELELGFALEDCLYCPASIGYLQGNVYARAISYV